MKGKLYKTKVIVKKMARWLQEPDYNVNYINSFIFCVQLVDIMFTFVATSYKS